MIKAQTLILPYVYNGFQGSATYDNENKVWYGKVLNSGVDLIPYEADNYNNLMEEFKKAVDEYIVFLEGLKNKDKDKTND